MISARFQVIFSDKWSGTLSQQRSTCYMSAFIAKVVQVGMGKVQTSSEKYVLETSQSFKQKQTKRVGGKKDGAL